MSAGARFIPPVLSGARGKSPGRELQGSRPDRRKCESGYPPTAANAFTWPCPNQLLYPLPPWQACGAPLSTAGKNAYMETSAGHAIGSAVLSIPALTAPPDV